MEFNMFFKKLHTILHTISHTTSYITVYDIVYDILYDIASSHIVYDIVCDIVLYDIAYDIVFDIVHDMFGNDGLCSNWYFHAFYFLQAVGRRGRGRQDIDIHLLNPALFHPDSEWALPQNGPIQYRIRHNYIIYIRYHMFVYDVVYTLNPLYRQTPAHRHVRNSFWRQEGENHVDGNHLGGVPETVSCFTWWVLFHATYIVY